VLPSGLAWLLDESNQKVIAVGPDGSVRFEQTVPAALAGFPRLRPRGESVRLLGPTDAGEWIFRVDQHDTTRAVGEVYRQRSRIVVLTPHGALDTLWSGSSDLGVQGGTLTSRNGGPLVEGGFLTGSNLSNLLLHPSGNGLWWAWSDSTWVDHLALDGSRTRVARVPVQALPAPPREPSPRQETGAPRSRGMNVLRAMDDRLQPEISGVIPTGDGRIWVLRVTREEDLAARGQYLLIGDRGRPVARWKPEELPGRVGFLMGRDVAAFGARVPGTDEAFVTLHRFERSRNDGSY
jgi:hypothetical protein